MNCLKYKKVVLGLLFFTFFSLNCIHGQNNFRSGTNSNRVWLLDPSGTYGGTGLSSPWLHVDGEIIFSNTPQGNANYVRYHSPNAENGHSMIQNSGERADVRFNGTTLKLVATNSGGVPSN